MRKKLTMILAAMGGLVSLAAAQDVGTCETGQAKRYLDINGVRAAIYNTGGLFWKGRQGEYNVPVGTTSGAFRASNLWIGGLVDGELRMSASSYGPWEMWPGPIPADGSPPNDCSSYDRIYKVSRYELAELDNSGTVTPDIRDWPWQLGAPVQDGDGILENYDLDAGDRPRIEGDQTLWWIMNDLGNEHDWSRFNAQGPDFKPLGIEVRVTAYAASSPDPAINFTTVYRYELTNRGARPIEQTYFSFWADPDLGDENDDFLGSDSARGLAYVWNGDDFDGDRPNRAGYGDRPPALAYNLIKGPTVGGERLPMTNFHTYGGDSTVQGNPDSGQDAYGYQQSLWRDGVPVTYGGTGRSYSETPTTWMYSGRPPDFWSEENTDDAGSRNTPRDVRFLWSTGPFTILPGESQEVEYALMFVQGADRFDSVYRLLDAAPRVKQTILDGLPSFEGEAPTERTPLLAPADGAFGQPTNPVFKWAEVASADRYLLEVHDGETIYSTTIHVRPFPIDEAGEETEFEQTLLADKTYRWRVRPRNAAGYGPPSQWSTFSTGNLALEGGRSLTIEGGPDGTPAFIQIEGLGADDVCGPDAGSTFGCSEVGGNGVYGSLNGQGDWVMYHQGRGPEDFIGQFAPNDFEVRVTESGSYGYHPFADADGAAHWLPFEVWDIGEVGPFGVNDTLDDVRMVPIVFSDNGGVCEFAFGEIEEDPFGMGWPVTDRVYAYYPTTTYDDWLAAIRPIVDADPESCPASPETDAASSLIDLDRGRPLQRLTFMMDPESPNYRPEMIPVGNVIRFLTTKPVPPIPSAPASGASVGTEVALYWQLPPDVDSTRIQLFSATEPPTLVDDWNVAGESFTTPALDAGAYLWRLAYRKEEWSDAWTFVVVPGTSAEGAQTGLPTRLELKPAYPNPLSDQTTFTYGLPEAGHVSIKVFDLLGREVATVAEGNHAAGWHSGPWRPEGLRSGVYFAVIELAGARQTRPVTIVN